jgi:hypothetical protein
MSTGSIFKKSSGIVLLSAFVLCLGAVGQAATVHTKKATKKQPPPPLPSGPTGKIPQIPLDAIKPVLPQVSYQNGQLTIVSPNSTLGDILRAVHKQTGAEIEIPDAQERVVTQLGPGPARAVVAELLNGSRFNYVLLGSQEDANILTKVVLVAKSGPETPGQPGEKPASPQAGNMAPPPSQEVAQEANDAEAPEENANADENADAQPVEEQPAAQPDQPGVKTPQQMLQEMQQRQMQMQQQLAPGQPPVPGGGLPPGMPPRPPQ